IPSTRSPAIAEGRQPDTSNPTQAENDSEEADGDAEEAKYRYPPNAFLTYWGVKSLRSFPDLELEMRDRLGLAETWLHGTIGREMGLQYSGSRNRDPQQLAWAICGLASTRSGRLSDRGGEVGELAEVGLSAFFDQQLEDGSWETGRALFHYPEAGNAYCYLYETLAELLNLSLSDDIQLATEFRHLLRPYVPHLLRARDYLMANARPLGPPGLVGWSSGHHPHRTTPESWATATAFRFLQALRRFVGLAVRELAATELRATKSSGGLEAMSLRGKTWNCGLGSTGDLLAGLFVHPTKSCSQPLQRTDPDLPLLKEEWARSAILYGPPGTGKTTLAKTVAGALNWQFVEITAAQFLNDGTQMVSARADSIFDQLMELDQAVVLLDEIDELVQVRDGSADMLNRFFTTTMLPRLAKLWDARKLIFFVNTNSISRVDPAIRRSQRFDAAVLVLPPNYESKIKQLNDKKPDGLPTFEKIQKVLDESEPSDLTKEEKRLAVFALLRYDQVQRLANESVQSKDELVARIDKFATELLRSDWLAAVEHQNGGNNNRSSTLTADDVASKLFEALRSEREFQRLDSGRTCMMEKIQRATGSDGTDDDIRGGQVGTSTYSAWDPEDSG
ncbi:MAG: AAA family ATPase, partial [Acidimicrobiales bacterium]